MNTQKERGDEQFDTMFILPSDYMMRILIHILETEIKKM